MQERNNPTVRHRLTITLKASRAHPQGRELVAEYPDYETAMEELRFIDKARRARWGLPVIALTTVEGENWCLGYCDIQWPPVLESVDSAGGAD